MVTLIIFLLLSLVEFIVIYMKWSELSDLNTIAKLASTVVGVEKHYNTFMEKIVLFLMKIKPLLWVVVIVLALVNYIAASILSALIGIITFFFA